MVPKEWVRILLKQIQAESKSDSVFLAFVCISQTGYARNQFSVQFTRVNLPHDRINWEVFPILLEILDGILSQTNSQAFIHSRKCLLLLRCDSKWKHQLRACQLGSRDHKGLHTFYLRWKIQTLITSESEESSKQIDTHFWTEKTRI